jgi:very-short-patch-repair endonuclease
MALFDIDDPNAALGYRNFRAAARQLWLEQEGYRVIRFWNSEINRDLTAVLERIYVELHGSREAEVTRLKHHRRR